MKLQLSALLEAARARRTTLGGIGTAWLAERFIARLGASDAARVSLVLNGTAALSASTGRVLLAPSSLLTLQLRPRDEGRLSDLLWEVCSVNGEDGVSFASPEFLHALDRPAVRGWWRSARLQARVNEHELALHVDILIKRYGTVEVVDELHPVLLAGFGSSRPLGIRPEWQYAELLVSLAGNRSDGRLMDRFVDLWRLQTRSKGLDPRVLDTAVKVAIVRAGIVDVRALLAPFASEPPGALAQQGGQRVKDAGFEAAGAAQGSGVRAPVSPESLQAEIHAFLSLNLKPGSLERATAAAARRKGSRSANGRSWHSG